MKLFRALRALNPQVEKNLEKGVFTGNCLVFEHTADGGYVGRCWFSTYDFLCPRHGDVSKWSLSADPHWPNDYQLPKYDGQEWAERLRKR